MSTARPFLTLILRFDWAIYLLIVGGLLCVFGVELASANSVPTAPTSPIVLPLGRISLGGIYSLIVLVVIPVSAFVLVNLRASRKFQARLKGKTTVPTVEATIPIVHAKRKAEKKAVSKWS